MVSLIGALILSCIFSCNIPVVLPLYAFLLIRKMYCNLYAYLARGNKHKVHNLTQSYTRQRMCIYTNIHATNIRHSIYTFSCVKQSQRDAYIYKTSTKSLIPIHTYVWASLEKLNAEANASMQTGNYIKYTHLYLYTKACTVSYRKKTSLT